MNDIITKQVTMKSGRVTTEGDELYYEVRGRGQPLLMIAPAGGDGYQYSFVADILADEYKVITYDRRGNARSTMNDPQNFEISQQSRDAMAVLRAAGETSAFVFGNSSGAVIGLAMAKTQPQVIRALVAHEAVIPRMLPDAKKWQQFYARVYLTAFRFGSSLAALQFLFGIQVPVLQMIKASRNVSIHRKQSSQRYLSNKDTSDVLMKQELLPVTNYLPDVHRIKQKGVRVFVAVGQWALDRKTWCAQANQILAEKLGCELVTFPGHHGSFMDMPDEFAGTLRSVLRKMERINQ